MKYNRIHIIIVFTSKNRGDDIIEAFDGQDAMAKATVTPRPLSRFSRSEYAAHGWHYTDPEITQLT